MFPQFMKIKKSFEFERCEQKFAEKSKLTKHISAIHEKKKPFAVIKCSDSFATKFNLKRHLPSQHKNNYYQCYICKTPLSSPDSLNQNQFMVEERNYLTIPMKVVKCSDLCTD